MRPQSLAVLGLGAIGGSLAWQARLAGVPSVIGYSPDRGDSVEALRSGAVHDIADTPFRAVRGADLVVLAAPPMAILDLLGQIAPHLAPGALVTDVASIKFPMIARALELGLGARFAGSHPFAGTHIAGWAGAAKDRFTGAIVYVSSTGAVGDAAAREVMNFWEAVLGSHPVLVDALAHDTQLAWTSHLPQAVASALGHALAREPTLQGASWGTGARDTTRLAASPAEMWVDIFLMNREPVCHAMRRDEAELAALRMLIEAGDRAALYAYLEEAALFRRRLDEAAAPAGPSRRRATEPAEG
jgi:prephenate dehydrogenase